LSSPDRHYRLFMQADGNLVLYHDGVSTWASGTNGTALWLKNQTDGNLVLYRQDNGAAVWATGTSAAGPSTLYVQNDGNVVLRRNTDSLAVWSSMGVANLWNLNEARQIQSTATGNCLVVSGPSGSLAWTTWCGIAYADQVWTMRPASGGYQFVNSASGACLAVPYWTNYVPTQAACGDYADQMWTVVIASQTSRIKSPYTNTCIGSNATMESCDAADVYWQN
jgi:hypothetical protein